MNGIHKKLIPLILSVAITVSASFSNLGAIVYADREQSVTIPEQLSEFSTDCSEDDTYCAYTMIQQLTNPASEIQENTPIESQETLAEGEAAPVEGEAALVEGEAAPVEGEEAPVEGEEAPVEGEETPVEGEETPVEGEETPVEGEETPVEGEAAPVEGEETSVEEETPVEGEETPVEGEAAPVEGEEATIAEPNYEMDSTVKLLPNLQAISSFIATGEEVTQSGPYLFNGLKATSRADLNTSDSYQAFALTNNLKVENNGRIWVDKSVTLDTEFDYLPGNTISDGNFNVILSAMGQDYTTTPPPQVDVVFVLDSSGSMKGNRVKASVNAINIAIDTLISQKNSDLRFGVVTYGGKCTKNCQGDGRWGTWIPTYKTLITLDRYEKISNKQYLMSNDDGTVVYTNENLKKKNSDVNISSVSYDVNGGTYTQLGIQEGAKMLEGVSDTSGRVPALVLLSDGAPTYYTTNYENVSADSYLGDGGQDNDGDHNEGYYTILTAQYRKEEIQDNYLDYDVRFYTLGLGITDDYGKAVLNPNESNVNALNKKGASNSNKGLYNLLTSSETLFNGSSYATKSDYGNLTDAQLNKFFSDIAVSLSNIPSNPLKVNTSVVFEDKIGDGMEIKGGPIYIQYPDGNTGSIKTIPIEIDGDGEYSTSNIVVTDTYGNNQDLDQVKVKIDNGIIKWTIPRNLLPLITRDFTTGSTGEVSTEWVSTIPIRLIYTVGLKSEVTEGSYYTNAFDVVNNGKVAKTTVTFEPAVTTSGVSGNPYYTSTYQKDPIYKDDNITDTANTSSIEDFSNGKMTVTLGNNGRVDLSKNETNVTVTKSWKDNENAYGTRPESIKVKLYQNGVELPNKQIELNEAKGWTHTWTGLPKIDKDGKEYTYTVEEVPVPGYTTSVNGLIITNTLQTEDKIVTKTWNDNNNEYGTRPESIKVKLYQNGVELPNKQIELNEAKGWTHTWTGLPKVDKDGKEYTYTVEEVPVPGYTTSVNGLIITNTLIQGSITIDKKDKNGNPLSGVVFKLEKWNGDKWDLIKNGESDSWITHSGSVTINDLLVGRYRLTEIQTVEDYKLLESAIEFDIPYNESTLKLPNGVTIEDKTSNSSSPKLTITVTNYKNGILDNLPDTGGEGVIGYVIGGSCLVGLSTLLYSRQVRRKNVSKK